MEDLQTKQYRLINRSKKTNLFIRMNIVKTSEDNFSFLRLCDHIGEAHLFEWICIHSMENENNYYYHTDQKEKFEKEFQLKESTQYKYLKLLIQKELIIKVRNGVYQPNPKYVEFKTK